ncbi:D-isomer specific 2-hydroxyacid dehydrogenase family protein [Arcticibacter eurypsychrophilus]|uniref:D-isomer specific 2-hydroxyacid dehydrogenase family protein n=1 Tax=Arcticibacter eurypsychrophilus TaxID=1434752 RepID=UPI001112D855|nr:D-isomer specific 2-hydroxyacid dehydrogenase family protein [Arcticibacter eurypsychrophilus]
MQQEPAIKIMVYELRDDERKVFEDLAQDLNVVYTFSHKMLNMDTLPLAQGCQGICILGIGKISGDILRQMKEMNIHYLATRSVGFNNIDIEVARKLNIRVSNADYGPDGVADYTLMLILMSLRKYKQAMFRGNVNDYSLKGLQGKEMKDMTVGIIGTGRIGARVIDFLSGFGCRVLAYDPYPQDKVKEKAIYTDLETLYEESDIISLHVPLMEQTVKMINRNSLSKMKNGVILVNCSRGEMMNMPDVIEGIEKEKIGALALDVFENEDGIYHFDRRTDIIINRDMAYIRQFPNVIMTQHMAFYTENAVKSMVSCGVKNLVSFIKEGRADNEI